MKKKKQTVLSPNYSVPLSVRLPVCWKLEDFPGEQRYILHLSMGTKWELTYKIVHDLIGRSLDLTPENIDLLFKRQLLRQIA